MNLVIENLFQTNYEARIAIGFLKSIIFKFYYPNLEFERKFIVEGLTNY